MMARPAIVRRAVIVRVATVIVAVAAVAVAVIAARAANAPMDRRKTRSRLRAFLAEQNGRSGNGAAVCFPTFRLRTVRWRS